MYIHWMIHYNNQNHPRRFFERAAFLIAILRAGLQRYEYNFWRRLALDTKPIAIWFIFKKKKNESANFQIDKIRGTEYRLKTLEPRKALIFKIFELGIV